MLTPYHFRSQVQEARAGRVSPERVLAGSVTGWLHVALDARPRLVSLANIVAAALFVVGCVGFYWSSLYTLSVTAFLCGSLLFLLGALSSALLQNDPRHRK